MATRQQLLDAAEALFAERGFNSVTIRDIVTEAGANVAAVHYHFGSREALIDEVLARHTRRISELQMTLLAECHDGPERPPLIEQVIAACVVPALTVNTGTSGEVTTYNRLRAWLAAENSVVARKLMAKYFDRTMKLQVAALARALPGLSEEELYWRYHVMLGVIIFSEPIAKRVTSIAGKTYRFENADEALERLISLLVGLFRSPTGSPSPSIRQLIGQIRAA